MSARVSPTAAIRSELDALFASGRDLAEVVEDVALSVPITLPPWDDSGSWG